MGKKGANFDEHIERRSLTRVIIPFSIFGAEELLEHSITPFDFSFRRYKKALESTLKSKGAGNIFHELVNPIEAPVVLYHERSLDLLKSDLWDLVEKSEYTFRDMALPQIFDSLVGVQHESTKSEAVRQSEAENHSGITEKLANVSSLRLNGEAISRILPELTLSRYLMLELRKGKGKFLAKVSNIELQLTSSGAGLFTIDLHLVSEISNENHLGCDLEPLELEGGQKYIIADESHLQQLMEFNFCCQYLDSPRNSRAGKVLLIKQPDLHALARFGEKTIEREILKSHLSDINSKVRNQLNQQIGEVAKNYLERLGVENLDELHAEYVRGSSKAASPEDKDKMIGAIVGNLKGDLNKIWNKDIKIQLPLFKGLRCEDGYLEKMLDWASIADFGDAIQDSFAKETEATLSRLVGEMSPPQGWVKESFRELTQEVFSPTISKVHEAFENYRTTSSETFYSLFQRLVQDIISPESDRGAMCDIFLNGERNIIFTHALVSSEDVLEKEQLNDYAISLSRRYNKSHAEDQKSEDSGTECFRVIRPTGAITYAMSLEGVAVLQRLGVDPQFSLNSSVVRKRHYWMISLALLYRFNLLNMTFGALDSRDRKIQDIELVVDWVDHFTHTLYHNQLSHCGHYQEIFSNFMSEIDVDGCWESVGRSIMKYGEERKRKGDQMRQLKVERFQHLAVALTAVIGFSSIISTLPGELDYSELLPFMSSFTQMQSTIMVYGLLLAVSLTGSWIWAKHD